MKKITIVKTHIFQVIVLDWTTVCHRSHLREAKYESKFRIRVFMRNKPSLLIAIKKRKGSGARQGRPNNLSQPFRSSGVAVVRLSFPEVNRNDDALIPYSSPIWCSPTSSHDQLWGIPEKA